MDGYQQNGGYQQSPQQLDQHLGPQQQSTKPPDNYTGGAANDYYQQSGQQTQQPGYQQTGQGYTPNEQYNQQFQGQQANTQQGAQTNGRPGAQQLGAGEPPQAAEQDGLHKFLDRIEKKFGGDRFNDPANTEKNRKLNDSIIRKLKQVAKIVIRKGPGMAMRMMR